LTADVPDVEEVSSDRLERKDVTQSARTPGKQFTVDYAIARDPFHAILSVNGRIK